jgi:hypothetical protein
MPLVRGNERLVLGNGLIERVPVLRIAMEESLPRRRHEHELCVLPGRERDLEAGR